MMDEEASPTFSLQMDSGGEKFVEVPTEKVPASTTTIKTTTASKAECETACNKAPACKGYKHTDGSNQCTLLGHQIATPGAAAAPAADPVAAAKAAAAQKEAEAEQKKTADQKEMTDAAVKTAEVDKLKAEQDRKLAIKETAHDAAKMAELKQE